jgi:hypothetical protein
MVLRNTGSSPRGLWNDVLAQADIGQQMQHQRNGDGDQHDAEHLRHQQTGHDQVAAQAEGL